VRELCRRITDVRGDVRTLVDREVRRVVPLADADEQRRVADAAVARLTGLGELDPWVNDETVDEVLVNADQSIWIDRNGELQRVGTLTSQPLEHIIERILAPIGRRLDLTSPIVDARLADGSRVCAVVAPVGLDGSSLSIRRFARAVRPIEDFTCEGGSALIREILGARCNVVVTGATSSGKTSLLAALIGELPHTERIIVLEDTAELPIDGHHLVRLEARPACADGPPPIELPALVRTALRLRPDRLVVGEIRGDEVLGLVQAMNTGHDGSFATCHANGALDGLLRLESLVLQASPSWPLEAIRQQLARSIDIVVHVARRTSDGRRHVASINEVAAPSAQANTPVIRPLAEVDQAGRLHVIGQLGRRR
jgi:pilus assembly protein CpaF